VPLPLLAATEPGRGAIAWSVTNPDGTPTDRATIGADGVLHPTKLGAVKVIAQPRDEPGSTVRAELPLEIIADRVLADPLDDWTLTEAHSGNWTFDTLNTQLFEGKASRLKRTKDTPESVIWHCPGLRRVAARLYFLGELGDKVRFSASADKTAWTPLTMTTDAAVVTGWDWRRVNARLDVVPAGMNYLRVEFAGDAMIWSPQLSEIRIYSRAD
jgi:hypothetical protein